MIETDTSVPAATPWSGLLRAASAILGLDITPDAGGYVALVVDGHCTINIQCTDDGRKATVFCSLGVLDDGRLASVAPLLLSANFFWQGTGGATLGRHPQSGELVIARALSIEPYLALGSEQAAELLLMELKEFVDRAIAWQGQLESGAGQPMVGADAVIPRVKLEAQPFAPAAFLRV